MTTLLIDHVRLLVTMDADRREIPDGSVLIEDGVIRWVGPAGELADAWRRAPGLSTIDASNLVILPGMVNTHHHLFQSLTRALPQAQDAKLFDWLVSHYPRWNRLTPEMVYVSAKTAMAELVLTGATTVSDHLYLYANGATIDDEIRAARELGVRFHPCRGSMSIGESEGGLPPDNSVEDEDALLRETQRAIERWHDPARYAMCRIAVAPCAPFNVSEDLMRRSAELAREYGVLLHTHVAETQDEEAYTLERVGMRPAAYMASLGWVGPDVWWAHAVHLNAEEIALLAETGTGVSHCPSSNMRLGSGIAPVRAMLDAGVHVSLAVDGSASNDSNNMLAEARLAMLLQRVHGGADALSARQALAMATRGGAAVLGRDDLGSLRPGMAADLVGYDLDALELAGAQADPLAALLFCTPGRVSLSVINGNPVVEQGELIGTDLRSLAERHNTLSRALW
ncbi:MAG: 8-oxoguanine deaminase [Chloroflexi bacterium]|nr:8-oxoguanine deaminase [Chloroflexota bacterium]